MGQEEHFPFQLILHSLTTTIETAATSIPDDRCHILNAIIGNTEDQLDDEPLPAHTNYEKLNMLIRGSFASSYGVLLAAYRRSGDDWTTILSAMSTGGATNMTFDFLRRGWDTMTSDAFAELISHLPISIKSLTIVNATFGPAYIYALAQWIEKSSNLESLAFNNIKHAISSESHDEKECEQDAHSISSESHDEKECEQDAHYISSESLDLLDYCTDVKSREYAHEIRDDEKKYGQDVCAGAILANAISANSTIQSLILLDTDLIRSSNVSVWNHVLAEKTTLKTFRLSNVYLYLAKSEKSFLRKCALDNCTLEVRIH